MSTEIDVSPSDLRAIRRQYPALSEEYQTVVRMWVKGIGSAKIGLAIGKTGVDVNNVISRLRKRGHDIPRRKRAGHRRQGPLPAVWNPDCLRCHKAFESPSRFTRICPDCTIINESVNGALV